MKAIILISSIFFALGLKISSTINFPGKMAPVDSVVTKETPKTKPAKALRIFKIPEKKSKPDSVKFSGNGPIETESNQS